MTESEQYMSWAEFNENEGAILADVCVILAAKGKKRKEFRITALYERSTGRRVAELLHTSLGPVIVHRRSSIGTDGLTNPVDIREFRREHGVTPFTGAPEQQFPIKGDAAAYIVTGKNIADRSYPNNLLVFR